MLVLDRTVGDRWLVSSGIAPGDCVIVEGLQRLRPGVSVRVVSPEAAAGPASQAEVPAAHQPAAEAN